MTDDSNSATKVQLGKAMDIWGLFAGMWARDYLLEQG